MDKTYTITVGTKQIQRNQELLIMIAEVQSIGEDCITVNIERPCDSKTVAYKITCKLKDEDIVWLSFKYKYFERHCGVYK